MNPKKGEIKAYSNTIRDGNALIEITHGLTSGDLEAIPLLRMAYMVSEMREISLQIEEIAKKELPLTLEDILAPERDWLAGVKQRVTLMLNGEVIGLASGTTEQIFELQARLNFLVEQRLDVPLGFVGNPYVIETLAILNDVLIKEDAEVDSPPPPWLSSLEVCQSIKKQKLKNGITTTQLQIPRIVKNGAKCQSNFNQSADSGAEIFATNEDTKESVVVNISTDGVTVPGIENADIIARDAALEAYKNEEVQRKFANVNSVDEMLEAVDTFNLFFTEKVSESKKDASLDNPHATGAFTVTRILSDGRKRITSAVVGDARSTAIWVDKKGEIHVRSLTSPTNKEFDQISSGYARAEHKGFAKVRKILYEWYKNSYRDKYDGGVGTVAVFGENRLFDRNEPYSKQRNVHVAVDSFEIPADVQYFKVFTSTDGLDLYARLLDVPVWLADYILSGNNLHVDHSVLKYSLEPENLAETLFYSPMGIAGMQGAYMIHNLDTVPSDIEPRPKIDDLHTSSSEKGPDQFMLKYLLKKLHQANKTVPTSSSYENELQKLNNLWGGLFNYYGYKLESKLSENKRKRHKPKKR